MASAAVVALLAGSFFPSSSVAGTTAAQEHPLPVSTQARRSDLHEKSSVAINITFPAPNAVIDQGTMAIVPINVAIASGTPLESVTIHVCEAQNGVSCSNGHSPPSDISVSTNAPYQVMWNPPSISVSVSTSFKYMAWASARNAIGETATSDPVTFSYVMSPTRSIALVAPSRDLGFFAPASPVLWASFALDVSDPATVDHVDFLDGSTVIGSVTAPNSTPPGYAFTWANASMGSHEISARGVDSMGRTSTTRPISLYVVPPAGSISAALTQPRTGQVYGVDAPILLRATASVTQGTIERIEFVDGAAVVATVYDPPYEATWLTPSIGFHAIAARAFDDLGNASASAAAYVQTLGWPRRPAVVVMSPLQGSTTALKSPIAFSSMIEAPDAAISRVDYWVDNAVIASPTVPPYAFSWTSAKLGKHSAIAVAYDLAGRKGTSEAIVFNVTADGKPPTGDPPTAPPDIVLALPANNASFVEGDDIHLGANAAQTDGSISRVDFVANGVIVATTSASPWTANWTGASQGNYVLTATATNNRGLSATSAAVNIKVAAAPVSITMAAPASGTVYYPGDSIGLRPATMHVTGAVSRIEYYVDGMPIGNSVVSPYVYDWDVDASGTYSISARVFDTAGNSAQSLPISIVVDQITVRITSPVDGAVVDGPTVLVEGTFEGPRNTGIVVNDVVAVNNGKGRFFVNDVLLPAATNTLKATATSMGGSRISTSVIVKTGAPDDSSAQRIAVSNDEGIDSLSTRISVTHPDEIASWRAIDLAGGTMEAGTIGTEHIATLNFGAPGIYTPTMEITDKQGRVTKKRMVVLVSSSAEIVSSQMSIVNQFFDALLKQRKSRVLATMTGGVAGQFSQVYDTLKDHWPEIIRSLGSAGATMYGTEAFEAAVTRMRDGQKYLYLIEGIRDSDGVWRIDSF